MTPSSLVVRDARLDDLEDVLRLLNEDAIREMAEDYGDLTPYREAIAEILAAPHSTVLVGEVEGTIVATAQVTWQRRMMYGAGLVCQIESVRVDSHRRGEGIGSALIGWIVDDARRRGCARAELTSNAERTDARRFYERLGFNASHVGMKLYLGHAAARAAEPPQSWGMYPAPVQPPKNAFSDRGA
jgi:GNAT superfamily N-acetyltransferase